MENLACCMRPRTILQIHPFRCYSRTYTTPTQMYSPPLNWTLDTFVPRRSASRCRGKVSRRLKTKTLPARQRAGRKPHLLHGWECAGRVGCGIDGAMWFEVDRGGNTQFSHAPKWCTRARALSLTYTHEERLTDIIETAGELDKAIKSNAKTYTSLQH